MWKRPIWYENFFALLSSKKRNRDTVKYLLLISVSEQVDEQLNEEKFQRIASDCDIIMQQMREQGIVEYSTILVPTYSATTVRVRQGKIELVDGPFAEAKERICGCCLVKCDNLDYAIELARRIPSVTYGSVEIRPVYTF